ncbi:hypothetical protein C5167_017583 [Papaver somniferum]|uniref:Plant heme peroxidase family profile domain-containing protein n=1 Tax=Papaver somniferum TaxID=3469 RepID=A0A4Y7IKC4_PAPSO|nr:hypothetical protein C5167_017583 [Papaver somniferum]
MAQTNISHLMVLSLFLCLSFSPVYSFHLNPNFYEQSCPKAEEIVRSVVVKAVQKETRMTASLRRLHFHDCFVQAGGPNWVVPLGRRDSKTASLSGSNRNTPQPNNTFQTIIIKFKVQDLNIADLVALSGSHTIGNARCTSFRQRLYNQSGNGQADYTLQQVYANQLRSRCPRSGGDNNLFSMDLVSPAKFDNYYYKNILAQREFLILIKFF